MQFTKFKLKCISCNYSFIYIQGSTKNIEGLTCIQARFAYPGLSNTQVPVNPQDIYHVTKTSGSFVILNPLVSPFPEDDNLVRVVVIPDSEKGKITLFLVIQDQRGRVGWVGWIRLSKKIILPVKMVSKGVQAFLFQGR